MPPAKAGYDVEDRGHATPCYISHLKPGRDGYCRRKVVVDGVLVRGTAHRIAWVLERGEIPAGLVPDHLCRVRNCIRVDHLELVTNAENVRRGGHTILSTDDVLSIRRSDRRAVDLAADYGVSVHTVHEIRRARPRRWVDVLH